MGEHEGWAQPSGLLPNGLLPNAGPAIRVLDSERWLKAEERTAELIACIQPNSPSEDCRNAVADYVQRLIMKCFPCQVFTFGSVPLKTYLPDGDIDLTAFSNNQNLKDTWANQVRDMLKNEEKNKNAEFRVKEVQYIQAEVKIIKCLVENIVVDISFNQLGGLCTLCFLEEVDHLINQNHLFKRSIILIKAWCYYESRVLGAHHGLISTYALETLVLYIFHVFNNSFTGPLEVSVVILLFFVVLLFGLPFEGFLSFFLSFFLLFFVFFVFSFFLFWCVRLLQVLYRFLEFFSNFDWDNFCVSLWGPVSISSLPDVTAEPPRKDSGELLLSKLFLDACSSVYAVFPSGQENQGQPFVSKHFNVIDPLRVNNNLGRSVSKGNFFRIRSAFAFGAKRLARLLDCPKGNLVYEVNQFFMNTWDRHGSGNRPDAPKSDLWRMRLSTPDHPHGSENLKNISSVKKLNENSSGCETEVDGTRSRNVSSQHGNCSLESTSRNTEATRNQSQKSSGNLNRLRVSDQVVLEDSPTMGVHIDKGQRNVRPDHLVNDIQGRFLFARTRSSPELTDTYSDVFSQGRRNKAPESGKTQATPAGPDNNRRKNPGSEILVNHSARSSTDDPSSVKHVPSHQSLDAAVDSSSSNSYHRDSGSGAMGEEFYSASGPQGMHQEEQDLVNLMASSNIQSLNGQVHVPLNLASSHLPFPISPSILASMGYAQRHLAGMVPSNITLIDPSFSNMQLPQDTFGSVETNPEEADHDFWQDQDVRSPGGFEPYSRNYEMLQSDDKLQSSSAGHNFGPPSQFSGSGSSTRLHQKFTKENHGSMQEDHLDSLLYQDNRNDLSDDRTTSSRFSSAAHSSSLRSKTSSESSWDGSSSKVSKSTREKWGKKTVPAEPSTMHGKGKTVSEHATQPGEDARDWNPVSTTGSEMAERSSGPQPVGSLHGLMPHMHGYELVQTSGSDSMMPIAPVLLGPGSQERVMDNSGGVPFTFYPTGPPVPFLTMLPVYNIPPERGTSDTSTSHFGGEEGLDNSDSGQNFDSSEGFDQSEELNTTNSSRRAAFVETSNEHKPDILNSDFASHWQNLQFGRFCQNPPLIYPSPVVVPPMYLQGHFPWDGPGRPMSTNMNLFTQLMGYGHRLIPVSPLQSVANRPPNVYQRYVDEMPRYRSGTGTYLPNPKVAARDRHSSSAKKGNYNHDRSDNHGDREGNWNTNSKSRAAGRNHSRNQTEKSNSRLDRLAASESRAGRSWRHDPVPSYQSQNGPLRSNSSQSGPPNLAYGMYPLSAMNPNGVSSNGPTVPPVVMLYPFEHNASYGSHGEQLEFGSLGPVGFSSMNEQQQLSEGSRSREAFEEQRFHGGSMQRTSPDQPSSPHFPRRV
ncbi:Poly(A) RNA polymerase cid14 [Camellia lanceoleosa]|uniref:Poly(A) RNA polymerase cid14 n=1 Tax=Camellia lanceoleosa TaxID=1840588 RepID=A0ACC0ICM6_9ERIC|nr:Poly(A) RNA polymerase cid14 [Camellia lanceoleosa]